MKVRKISLLQRHLLREYLQKNELMTAPLFGNIEAVGWTYRYSLLRSGRIFALLGDDGAVYGAAAAFNDGNCMVHAADETDLLAFAETLSETRFHTLWILGCSRQTGLLLRKELKRPNARLITEWMLVQKDCVEEPARGLRFQDISTAPYDTEYLHTVQTFLKECFHYHPRIEVLAERMTERTKDEIYLLGALGEKWVCQAHIQAWTPQYGHIGGVATLPEYRGCGYAASLTSHLCRYIWDTGRIPTLTVQSDNRPALALYESLHFTKAGEITILDSYEEM